MKRTLLTGILAAATVVSTTTATVSDAAASTDTPGPGWTAAIQHQTSEDDDQGRLVMVRPQGGIVTLGEVSDDARIQDVSADGQYVITSRTHDDETRVTVWDTSSTKPSYFRIAAERSRLQFGGGGIVQLPEGGNRSFTIRGYDGSVKNRFAAEPPAADSHTSAAVTPDGKHIVETSDSILVRDAASGDVLDEVDQPEPKQSDRACRVVRAWGNDAVAVSCASTEGLDVSDHYRVDLDGTATTVETSFGIVWPTAYGTANGGSGNARADWKFTNTSGEVSDLPLGDEADVRGSDESRLYVVSSPFAGADKNEFFTYDVSTGERVTLAGTEETGGGVITDARTIDGFQ